MQYINYNRSVIIYIHFYYNLYQFVLLRRKVLQFHFKTADHLDNFIPLYATKKIDEFIYVCSLLTHTFIEYIANI